MPVKLWCCKYEGFPRLRPALLVLGPHSHLILAVWSEAVERECLFEYDAVIPGGEILQVRLGGGLILLSLSHLSLSFLDKGGIMFDQFDLFTAPFLFESYNL